MNFVGMLSKIEMGVDKLKENDLVNKEDFNDCIFYHAIKHWEIYPFLLNFFVFELFEVTYTFLLVQIFFLTFIFA